ncbi:hypothetical protein [Chryseobacterium sp. MFBS3-17]|uniref:hypothetical protein n=1 Tax=Chryseobacterium sp. MFBS3-17 TaxID=2886689 RepID=UPI001D0E1DDA|nr:hypothetical protein [Chryseobacterium sp. MFBS3-17]MCC2590882.1 hypothetical protein [Chryseobacterium sp. MFBS3-17]
MKFIFAITFVTAGIYLNAQNIGNSPYAAYGIGDVKYDNTVENAAMAGISTAYVTDFNSSFNFKNPAANENLQLTSIKLEATNENNFFKSDHNDYKVTKHSTYLSNISIAFPVSQKVKFGLGYQPYSSKNYNVVVTETLSDGSIKANNFRGEGTLSTVQGAISYQISPEFALGLRTNFYFGNLYDIDELMYSDAELINGYETRNRVKNYNFTLGTTYQKKYENDRKLTIGATTTFGNSNEMESYFTNSTYFYNNNGIKNYVSVVEERNTSGNNLLPLEASVGAGFGHNLRWFAGAQVDYRKGETIQFVGQDFQYQDSYRVAAGGWFLPNANNFRNYFERIIYRYGAFYEKGNLQINDTDINRFGITFGATLPFKNTTLNRMTGLDVGVELGKRGTLKNNLVNQNYINVKVGFNFADRWFQKRLYN